MTYTSSDGVRRWWLYVLKLEDGKYYVGITSKTPEIRMEEHVAHVRGAYWTKKFKPLEIIEEIDLGLTTKEEAEHLENKKTRHLMKQYGLNNVRGGDLRDMEDYVFKFSRYYKKEVWSDIKYFFLSSIALVILILLIIDKYMIPFLPGGIR